MPVSIQATRQTFITDYYTTPTRGIPETTKQSVECYEAIGRIFKKMTEVDDIRHQIYSYFDFASLLQFGASSRMVQHDPARIAIVDKQMEIRRQQQEELEWEEYIDSGGYAADEALYHEIGYYYS